VTFHGSDQTKRDNVKVRVTSEETRSFRVKVPLSANSGPISAWKSDTVGSDPSDPIAVLPPPPPERSADLTPSTGPRDPGAPRLETGISTVKAFFAGTKVRFSYRVNDDEPTPVTIELVHVDDNVVVRRWRPGPVDPEAVHTIRWNGQTAAPVHLQLEAALRMSQGKGGDGLVGGPRLAAGRSQELPAGGGIEEQSADRHGGTALARGGGHPLEPAADDAELGALRVAVVGGEAEPGDGGDSGQRFTPEAEGRDADEVRGRTDLAGGVPVE